MTPKIQRKIHLRAFQILPYSVHIECSAQLKFWSLYFYTINSYLQQSLILVTLYNIQVYIVSLHSCFLCIFSQVMKILSTVQIALISVCVILITANHSIIQNYCRQHGDSTTAFLALSIQRFCVEIQMTLSFLVVSFLPQVFYV